MAFCIHCCQTYRTTKNVHVFNGTVVLLDQIYVPASACDM
jgi:hypothetical protein